MNKHLLTLQAIPSDPFPPLGVNRAVHRLHRQLHRNDGRDMLCPKQILKNETAQPPSPTARLRMPLSSKRGPTERLVLLPAAI
jgi:hypothetical protein